MYSLVRTLFPISATLSPCEAFSLIEVCPYLPFLLTIACHHYCGGVVFD
jgi:hypothetical protein